MSTNLHGGAPDSGINKPTDLDPATHAADRADMRLADRQGIEGRHDDDLGAGSEAEMQSLAARSTPSSADVRSDDRGVPNGEPR